MKPEYLVQNQQELERLFGAPSERVQQKVVNQLDQAMGEFITRSPLIFLSTIDSNDLIDVSPKGDAPGFVKVDHEGNLLVPERPGNKLMFGFNNIFNNPSVGLIFVVPNTRETLRVKGNAVISRDPELLENLSAQNTPALLCTHITVQECFFHCGKAMIRSKLWQSDSWQDDEKLMIKHFARKDQIEEQAIDASLEQAYRDNLY